MARRLAVAIGVAKVEGLPYLAGVRRGLDDFVAWAQGQGFTVVPHDDAIHPVRRRDIYESVRDAVKAGDVERLFIFFGGHGLSVGTGHDAWLLSDAREDPGEAVDVARSWHLARWCGIPHIAFFADACRTAPEIQFQAVHGEAIFPSERITSVQVQVDTFYATISGEPSFELGPAPGEGAYGLFSQCLVDALEGRHDEILTPVHGGEASHALLAHPLGTHLYTRVRDVSPGRVGFTQTPDCNPTSTWQPNALAWFDRARAEPAPIPVSAPPPAIPRVGEEDSGGNSENPTDGGDKSVDTHREPVAEPAEVVVKSDDVMPEAAEGPSPGRVPWRPPRAPDRQALIAKLAKAIVTRRGHVHFETRVGARVRGAEVIEAWVDGRTADVFEKNNAWHLQGVPDQGSAAFLRLRTSDNDSWLATALLPGYVTTVAVGPNGVENVAFAEHDSGDSDKDLQTVAFAVASLRAGDYGFVDDDEVRRLLDRAHPTMTVLAAYALDWAGLADRVQALFERCREALQPIPFDVVMLAEAPAKTDWELASAFPLMTRGWSLVDDLPAGARWLAYARPRLGRTLWTTFTDLSTDAIVALSESQTVRA